MKHKTTYIALIALLFTTIPLKSQGNLPYVDDKPIHFGFSLGLNFMDFATVPADIYSDVEVSRIMPGFKVGAISDLRLNRYFNLRFTPTLHLTQRTLNYQSNSSSTNVLSIPMLLPLYLKYSAERNGNFRPYIMAGGGIWYDWGRDKERPILLKTTDLLAEFAVGCDIYFSFFKLSPELKFSIGLANMLTPISQRDAGLITPENAFYTNSLTKLTTRMITLSFNFE